MARLKLNDTNPLNTEATFYNGIYSEVIQLYGDDLKYIPVELKVEDIMFGEFLKKNLKTALDMSLFISETDGFGGGSNLMMTKFGAQFISQITCYGDKAQFNALNIIPKPGDLIYLPKTDKIFQVESVTDDGETQFYPFGSSKFSYKIEATIYGASNETPSTGIADIDSNLLMIDDLMVDEENEQIAAKITTDNVLDTTESNPLFEE